MSALTAISTPVWHASLPWWHVALLVVPGAAALFGAALSRRASTVAQAWRGARVATMVMMAAASVLAGVRVVSGDRANGLLRADVVGAVMALLVSVVGWAVVRYSVAYLAGDPHERRYLGRLMVTLAAVSVVVVANHLVVLVAAWAATSLALHGLLTFYPDRPVALAVAHKKFLLARLADLAMVAAVVALWSWAGTGRMDRIAVAAQQATSLPTGARLGVALVAVAALLKCAQLPFHGWLIQVMEAPTPVSAFLHAGVVNLGGFVLLRFAPLVDRAPETRVLLTVVGTATAVVAALVMTTRVSVKVSLAWSTCAQMGFMVLQCGLGLWPMALLHLVAHSLYKAHAFLAAGGAVRQTQRRQLAVAPRLTLTMVLRGVALALPMTAMVVGAWHLLPFADDPSSSTWLLAGIVALAIVPLLTRTSVGALAGAAAIPVAYLGLHDVAGRLVPHGPAPAIAVLVAVGLAFTALFALQTLCVVAPRHAAVQRTYPWIYGGLFLDEAFTRAAFTLWPPPPPHPRPVPLAAPAQLTVAEPALVQGVGVLVKGGIV